MSCPHCGADVERAARTCTSCGGALAASSVLSLHGMEGGPGADADPSSRSAPSTAASGSSRTGTARMGTSSRASRPQLAAGRYAPGEVLAGRYRIVQRLGEGGMGEVYRADDLAVEQPVALKLLRPELAGDALLVERLRAEVRLARRVSHPNVCRVHDLGEVDGQPFLSMELVEGEDLEQLLRRSGRPSLERALGLARQVCTGLAAAHAQGVLHRDLKPGNVLVDGDGQVKLSDFGLALDAGDTAGSFAGAGTPAYMAPEQLAGAPASESTDLYALGLVLWELLTGERLHPAQDLESLRAAHARPVPPLSETLPDVDRDLERMVHQCLARDPEARPRSAVQVLAAFPGSDLLSASMAAGEPPSPELVAAVGEHGALAPRWAGLALLLGLALLVCVVLLDARVTLEGRTALPLDPAVLEHRARTLLREQGLPDDAADSASGWARMGSTLRWMAGESFGGAHWDRLARPGPPALVFWYRESPNLLVPHSAQGHVGPLDPSLQTEGQRTVWLSPRGELLFFAAAPPLAPGLETGRPKASQPDLEAVDWSGLLIAAGLAPPSAGDGEAAGELLSAPDPDLVLPFATDAMRAWEGVYPGTEDQEVEAVGGALGGRPVFFQVMLPGTWILGRHALHGYVESSPSAWAGLVFELVMLIGGAVLARRHWARGWGDRRGALRLLVWVLGVQIVAWALGAHHTANPHQELSNFARFAGHALYDAGLVWLAYLAFEPIVRRRWPERLTAWSRLASGRWRDPLVGRSLLAAVLLALALHLTTQLGVALGWHFERAQILPLAGDLRFLGRPRLALAGLLETSISAFVPALGFVVLFVALRLVVRYERLAAVLVVGMGLMLKSARESTGVVGLDLGIALLHGGLMYVLIVRQGLLTLITAIACVLVMMDFSLVLDRGGWTTTGSLVPLAFLAGLLLLGARVAAPRLRLGG